MRLKTLAALSALLAVGLASAVAQTKPTVAVLTVDSPLYGSAVISTTRQAGNLYAGDPVLLVSSQDRRTTLDGVPTIWYQVKSAAGVTGWIPGSRLAFSSTAFPRSAFRSLEQYTAYMLMAVRVGDRVVAARSYEKVQKGDIGYYVSYHEGGLPFAIVWERNLAATPSMDYLPKDFPKELVPFVYYVEIPVIELLGDQNATPLSELAQTLPARFPTEDGFYASAVDEPFPWYLPPEASYSSGYDGYGGDDYAEDDYAEGDYDYDDEDGYYDGYDEAFVEGVESYGMIKVGSVVILGKHDDVNGGANWSDAMNAFVGKEATVTSLPGADSFGFLVVRVSGNSYAWRVRNLALKNRGEQGSYGYQVGDQVILGAHRFINDDNNWANSMGAYVGQTATITSLEGDDGSGCYVVHVDIDNGDWFWRVETMQPAK